MIKKLLTTLLTILLVVGMSVPVFGDEYVKSPNKDHKSDVVIDGKTPDEKGQTHKEVINKDGSKNDIIVTPYKDRENIQDEKALKRINDAYKDLEETKDLSKLNSKLKKIANNKKANTEDLSARYIFDITIYDEDKKVVEDINNIDDENLELKLTFESLDDFICLMKYENGKWEIVENVKIDSENKNTLSFKLNSPSATYSIIVANAYNYVEEPIIEPTVPCLTHWWLLIVGIISSILIIIVRPKKDERSKYDTYEDAKEKAKIANLIKILLVLIDFVVSVLLLGRFGECIHDYDCLAINIFLTLVAYALSFIKVKKKDE